MTHVGGFVEEETRSVSTSVSLPPGYYVKWSGRCGREPTHRSQSGLVNTPGNCPRLKYIKKDGAEYANCMADVMGTAYIGNVTVNINKEVNLQFIPSAGATVQHDGQW